jgi:hypothetical protein
MKEAAARNKLESLQKACETLENIVVRFLDKAAAPPLLGGSARVIARFGRSSPMFRFTSSGLLWCCNGRHGVDHDDA